MLFYFNFNLQAVELREHCSDILDTL